MTTSTVPEPRVSRVKRTPLTKLRPQTRKPKSLAITRPQRARYLELVASGVESPDAARQVDDRYTGRLFLSLARNDPEFAEALAEAVQEGKRSRGEVYVAELREARRHVALVERNPRTLHYESIAYDPDYRAAHTKQQVEMTGPQGGPLEVRVDVTFAQLQELLAQRAGAARDAGGVARLSAVAELSAARSAP